MNNLEERIQKMLNGEKKRREVALNWLHTIEEILFPVAQDIWGSGNCYGGFSEGTGATTITRKTKDNKIEDTEIYFRYIAGREDCGFYYGNDYIPDYDGKNISNIKGKEFWYSIQVIIDWVSRLPEIMDKREDSREKLLAKINF
jgi:hypothetical protein